MSVILLRKNASIHLTTSYKSFLSHFLIPVILSANGCSETSKMIQNDHQIVFPVEQGGTSRWDAGWAEILTIHSRPGVLPVTRNCLSKLVFFSLLLWALSTFFPQLTTDTKAFRLAIVCFSCLVNRSTKCNVPWATLNRFTVICCVQGTQVLWSLRVVFVRHDGEMKVCFAVAPSLLRERVERRWLQFACSSVAEMNGWHLWFH